MAVALVLDFPGATKQQYDEVVERMQLGGRMAPGGLFHAAGSYGDGWRVIDVWDRLSQFERFRDEQIIPHVTAVGMGPPNARVIDVDEFKGGSGAEPVLVQVVTLPGLDREAFHAADDKVLADGIPDALTFHVNGPVENGWCVIDAWSSKQARDEFLETRIKPGTADAPLQGPPQIEDLTVEATIAAGERETASA